MIQVHPCAGEARHRLERVFVMPGRIVRDQS
jgi:hypothetical protein